MNIDEILAALDGMDEKTKAETIKQAEAVIANEFGGEVPKWIPNPGPQSDAYFCEADELFYGGSAGSGKSALAIGLATTAHKSSLMLRRTSKEAQGLVEDMSRIVGSREGFNSQQSIWRFPDGKMVEIGGCEHEDDKQKYKGRAHDLKVWDEVSDFSESQYMFINTWNRSVDPTVRCRVVATGNPPTRPEGLWVIKRWAAWLDPKHPNPAKPGELRWYVNNRAGREVEVDGRGPHLIDGEMLEAKSRTFIPGKLSDNPDLAATNYGATLNALPKELRDAYRDGRFDVGLKDAAYQAIPTEWVREAQKRWTEQPPHGIPMCAMGVDASGGGTDQMVIAMRHDGWYAPMVVVEPEEIPITRAGAHCAGIILSHRRDNATVVIDLGGGYGSSMYEQLHANGIEVKGYKGAVAAYGKDKSGRLGFQNARSAAIWRFREALDPGQPGGSRIMLPDDPELVADLCAPTYEPDSKVIRVEAKIKVCERLGRSTNRGDAVIMAFTEGLKEANITGGFIAKHNRDKVPKVILGHAAARRR